MITIFSFILVIGVVVFIHELGHFLAAKSVGVKVEKFYLGFNFFGLGISKVYKGTEYGIGLFPLGGYVKVAGVIDESMDSQYTGSPDEFRSKNMFQKIWIMSAGVIMNFILSTLIFSHLTYHNGINEPDPSSIIGSVIPNYPAEKLGLVEGDKITSINGIKISKWEDLTDIIHKNANNEVSISWKRNEQLMNGVAVIKATNQLVGDKMVEQGLIGISPVIINKDASILEAFVYGSKQTLSFLDLTYRSLMALIKGNVSVKELAGPLMIAKVAGETASAGFNALLGLMAFISVNLGLVNILPVPGLDGGHVVIALIEGCMRREIPLKIKLAIQQAGMFLLMILFITIMVNDIQRLFQ